MGIRFIVRGTSKTAWYSNEGASSGDFANVADAVTVDANANTGVFGGSVINLIPSSVTKGLIYNGGLNVGATGNNGTFSVLARLVPSATASPFVGFGVEIGCTRGAHGFGYRVGINSAGKAYMQIADVAGNVTTYTGATVNNVTINVPVEFMWTWNGTAAANAIKVSKDGVEIESITSTNTCTNRIVRTTNSICIGTITAGPTTIKCSLNELIIYDTVVNHVYSARTGFDSQATFDAQQNADPGIANVRLNTGYTIAGVSLTGNVTVPTVGNVKTAQTYDTLLSLTGTYDGSDRWTDPGVANVLSGTAYKANSTSNNRTGTYHDYVSTNPGAANVLSGTGYTINDVSYTGSYHNATYSDPGVSHVAVGTNYIYADVTQTGLLNVPTPASGTAGTCDTNTIKETIRWVLNEANTTTGAPIDLSNNLSRQVQSILKINPEKIMPQASLFPCITIFLDSKSMEQKTIASNQVYGKRLAKLVFKIVGMTWNDRMLTYKEDPSDNDLEYLMENVELILRSYADLNKNCNWQFPTGVTYHSSGIDEQTHFRVGVIDLEVTILY